MEDIKKFVYFDSNDKLVVRTDNGAIIDDGAKTEVEVEGQFIIGSEAVARLMAYFGKQTLKTRVYTWTGSSYQILSGSDAVKKILVDDYRSKESLEQQLKDCQAELNELKLKVSEFNDSRRFYERKLK